MLEEQSIKELRDKIITLRNALDFERRKNKLLNTELFNIMSEAESYTRGLAQRFEDNKNRLDEHAQERLVYIEGRGRVDWT